MKMEIISRNFFRLLRAGIFGSKEQVEPMSQWKWRQTWQLAVAHGVEAEAWEGVKRLQSQFFMHLADDLWADWERSVHSNISQKDHPVVSGGPVVSEVPEYPEYPVAPVAPEAPLLSRSQQKRLSKIAADANVRSATFRLLILATQTANGLLKTGQWVGALLAMGRLLQSEGRFVDADSLEDWADTMHVDRMLGMEGLLMVRLLGFDADAVPFYVPSGNEGKEERMVEDAVASMRATRPSLRFIKYFPQESITTYTASVVQSIKNIEE